MIKPEKRETLNIWEDVENWVIVSLKNDIKQLDIAKQNNLSFHKRKKKYAMDNTSIKETILNMIKEMNIEQNYNSIDIQKSIEIVYGIRNFIGNANKFSKKNIFITVTSDSENSSISIEDDGPGFPKDILTKIGEPYIKSLQSKNKSKAGLGLGIFIGKTLLEKNKAKLLFRNSETRGGAEIKIEWSNKNLTDI